MRKVALSVSGAGPGPGTAVVGPDAKGISTGTDPYTPEEGGSPRSGRGSGDTGSAAASGIVATAASLSTTGSPAVDASGAEAGAALMASTDACSSCWRSRTSKCRISSWSSSICARRSRAEEGALNTDEVSAVTRGVAAN